MDYEKKAILSVNGKLESAIKEIDGIKQGEYTESICKICDMIKETIINLNALSEKLQ